MNSDSFHYHSMLSDFFLEKQLYLDVPICQKPNTRKLMELPWQLMGIKDWGRLSELLVSPDFMKELNNIKLYEYVTTVLTFLNRSGKDAAKIFQSFIRNPKSYTIEILTLVHNILKITGSLNEAETISKHTISNAQKSGEPTEVYRSILLTIGTMKAKGNFDYYDILTTAEEICNKLGDEFNLSRCMAHYADYYKYHKKDLSEGLKWHQKEEIILRKIRKTESLATCLNNQAVTYGKLGDPQKQLELMLEVDKIGLGMGNMDIIARSDSNLGMFYINAARIQSSNAEGFNISVHAKKFYLNFDDALTNMTRGWILLMKAESGYHELGLTHSLAGVLRRQAEIIYELIQTPLSEFSEDITNAISNIAIPKANEACNQYLKYGEYRQNEVERLKKMIENMSDWVERTKSDQNTGIFGSFFKLSGPDTIFNEEAKINQQFAKFILAHK